MNFPAAFHRITTPAVLCHLQAGDSLKVLCVVRGQGEVVGQGRGGNPHARPCPAERPPILAGWPGRTKTIACWSRRTRTSKPLANSAKVRPSCCFRRGEAWHSRRGGESFGLGVWLASSEYTADGKGGAGTGKLDRPKHTICRGRAHPKNTRYSGFQNRWRFLPQFATVGLVCFGTGTRNGGTRGCRVFNRLVYARSPMRARGEWRVWVPSAWPPPLPCLQGHL
jgi:hypothetical protein